MDPQTQLLYDRKSCLAKQSPGSYYTRGSSSGSSISRWRLPPADWAEDAKRRRPDAVEIRRTLSFALHEPRRQTTADSNRAAAALPLHVPAFEDFSLFSRLPPQRATRFADAVAGAAAAAGGEKAPSRREHRIRGRRGSSGRRDDDGGHGRDDDGYGGRGRGSIDGDGDDGCRDASHISGRAEQGDNRCNGGDSVDGAGRSSGSDREPSSGRSSLRSALSSLSSSLSSLSLESDGGSAGSTRGLRHEDENVPLDSPLEAQRIVYTPRRGPLVAIVEVDEEEEEEEEGDGEGEYGEGNGDIASPSSSSSPTEVLSLEIDSGTSARDLPVPGESRLEQTEPVHPGNEEQIEKDGDGNPAPGCCGVDGGGGDAVPCGPSDQNVLAGPSRPPSVLGVVFARELAQLQDPEWMTAVGRMERRRLVGQGGCHLHSSDAPITMAPMTARLDPLPERVLAATQTEPPGRSVDASSQTMASAKRDFATATDVSSLIHAAVMTETLSAPPTRTAHTASQTETAAVARRDAALDPHLEWLEGRWLRGGDGEAPRVADAATATDGEGETRAPVTLPVVEAEAAGEARRACSVEAGSRTEVCIRGPSPPPPVELPDAAAAAAAVMGYDLLDAGATPLCENGHGHADRLLPPTAPATPSDGEDMREQEPIAGQAQPPDRAVLRPVATAADSQDGAGFVPSFVHFPAVRNAVGVATRFSGVASPPQHRQSGRHQQQQLDGMGRLVGARSAPELRKVVNAVAGRGGKEVASPPSSVPFVEGGGGSLGRVCRDRGDAGGSSDGRGGNSGGSGGGGEVVVVAGVSMRESWWIPLK
ncbi:hypothetical protein DFJ73DRAFT_962284 [Zopfochytrium polystomum]|nr:hypothetical protein DFJ73DRAFT_962284 [Zopfochytrium polystomum]